MSGGKKQKALLWALVGLAILGLAVPLGDWLGRHLKPEPEVQPVKVETPASPGVVVRVRKNPTVKPPAEIVKEPAAPVKAKTPTKTGTLGNDEIELALQNRESQFSRCWTQRLKETPGLKGQLSLQFEISPRGKVQDIQIVDSSIKDETMERCVVSVLERVPFREFSGGPVTLTFPLRFE